MRESKDIQEIHTFSMTTSRRKCLGGELNYGRLLGQDLFKVSRLVTSL